MTLQSMYKLRISISSIAVCLVLAFSSQSCGNSGPESAKLGLDSASKMAVTVMAELISLEVQNVPLGTILTELGQRTKITFTIPEEMKTEPLTASLQAAPIEEVLQQVLQGKLYSVQYRQEGDTQVVVGVDVLLPQNQVVGRASSGVPPTRSAQASRDTLQPTTLSDTKPPATQTNPELLNLEQILRESPDSATRIAALSSIASLETNDAMNAIVVKGLSDRAPEVREATLEILRYSVDPVPVSALASVATQDANPALRTGAMSLLVDQLGRGEGGGQEDRDIVRTILQQGMADSDPHVREQATMLLENH